MSERPSDLREEVRRLAAEDLAAGGDHPPPEELIAYHERSLPEARAAELRDHLAVCSECTALVLEFEEHWAGGAVRERAYEPWYLRPGPVWAVAAALAAVALGLVVWHVRTGPETSVPYLTSNLNPGTTRGAPDVPVVTAPDSFESVGLVLDTRRIWDPAAEVIYAATLSADGDVVATAEGPINEPGEFILVLPRRVLRAGDYEVVLRDPGGSAELKYGFRFVEPESEPGAPAEAEPRAGR